MFRKDDALIGAMLGAAALWPGSYGSAPRPRNPRDTRKSRNRARNRATRKMHQHQRRRLR